MTTKHTPGPWTAHKFPSAGRGSYWLVRRGAWDIAHCQHSACPEAEEAANARLIAAAPEMKDLLDRLEQLGVAFQEGTRNGETMGALSNLIDEARKLMVKLTG